MTSGYSRSSGDHFGEIVLSRLNIVRETVRALKVIPSDDFSACFEDWRKRLHKCIGVGWEFFEMDDVDLEE